MKRSEIKDLAGFSAAVFGIMLLFAALVYLFCVVLADNSTAKAMMGVVLGIVLIPIISCVSKKYELK